MNVLLISTVREFYRQRAGFFFVLLGLLFGFLSGREHYAFALFFLNDRFGMLYLFLIWALYTLMVGQFVRQQWARPDYTFIYHTRLLPPARRYYYLAAVGLGLLQPVLYYGGYLMIIARQEKIIPAAWPVPLYWLLLTLGVVAVADGRLRHPNTVSQKAGGRELPFARPRSWTFWTLEWLVRERALTLLLCKSGAMLFMTATLIYFHTGTYDLRLPAIGCTFAYLLNVGLSYEIYQWESRAWLWGRSLPVPATKRYLQAVLLHAVLLLPETLVALRYLGGLLTLTGLLQLYGLGLASVLVYHTYLYRQDRLLEDTVRPLFIAYVLLTFLILYHLPLWVLVTGGGVASFWWWKRRW
ncbi:hypothetical protein [Telluribacter sp. SYSU D00476]|uniref:hypothetical protein n=1 Tax=Telluribacter sp. SYSU D00476 TaxID=2811430 RepID=UPI001FF221B3|nr:hypothetical protein [Telluribacter sp. SYSU D00476]